MKKKQKQKFQLFFHEMAAILDVMILRKEHITSKLLFQTQKKVCTHTEDVYIKEHTQETHIILCISYSFDAPLNRCSRKDILWISGYPSFPSLFDRSGKDTFWKQTFWLA